MGVRELSVSAVCVLATFDEYVCLCAGAYVGACPGRCNKLGRVALFQVFGEGSERHHAPCNNYLAYANKGHAPHGIDARQTQGGRGAGSAKAERALREIEPHSDTQKMGM